MLWFYFPDPWSSAWPWGLLWLMKGGWKWCVLLPSGHFLACSTPPATTTINDLTGRGPIQPGSWVRMMWNKQSLVSAHEGHVAWARNKLWCYSLSPPVQRSPPDATWGFTCHWESFLHQLFHQALQNGEISKFIIPSVLIYLTFLLHFYSSGSVILKKPSFVSRLVILEISPYRKGRINAASSFLFMSYLNKELLSPAPSPSPKVTSKGFFFLLYLYAFKLWLFV